MPLSAAARAVVAAGGATLADLITGGEDYEVLATIPPHACRRIRAPRSRGGNSRHAHRFIDDGAAGGCASSTEAVAPWRSPAPAGITFGLSLPRVFRGSMRPNGTRCHRAGVWHSRDQRHPIVFVWPYPGGSEAFGGQAKLAAALRVSPELGSAVIESNNQDGFMLAFRAPARLRGCAPCQASVQNAAAWRHARRAGGSSALLLVGAPGARAGGAGQLVGKHHRLRARPTTRTAAGTTTARDRPQTAATPLDDLRPDAMPMRSDEMIAAMDAAIANAIRQIADNGGWPLMPPGRMMREGEDDERVPLLRQRLQMSGDLRAAPPPTTPTPSTSELADRRAPLPAPQWSAPHRPRRALDLSRAQHDGR